MRADLQEAWDKAKKTDGTIYKNPGVEEIEPILSPSEKVIVILKCLKKTGSLGGGQVCTAVLTDQTIHIFSRGVMKTVNHSHETIPFSTITGVELGRKLSLGWIITFTRAANTDSLLKCDENGSKIMVSEVQRIIAELRSGNAAPKAASDIGAIEKIQKLKEMFDQGILSQKEFEEKKAELLKQI